MERERARARACALTRESEKERKRDVTREREKERERFLIGTGLLSSEIRQSGIQNSISYHKTVVAVNAPSARVTEGVPINNTLSLSGNEGH